MARAVLVILALGVLAWLGTRAGHVQSEPTPAASTPTTLTRSPAPAPAATTPVTDPTTPALAVVPPDPEVAAAFAAETARLSSEFALAWVDAEGVHLLGSSPSDTAWSTIKVPLAIAAVNADSGEATWGDVTAALTRSDNDAAARLWSGLGAPEEAASTVEAVLADYAAPEVLVVSDVARPEFSAYGQTPWTVQSQVRFASALACLPPQSSAGRVHAAMGEAIPEHRWGIGAFESAHVKGGWGPEPDGAYVLRQFGDATVGGQRYAWAFSARAASGGYGRASDDATAVLQWWGRHVAPTAPGLVCADGAP